MGEYTYLCHHCQNIFKVVVTGESAPAEEGKCPACGSSHIEEMPSWAPIGFNLPEGLPVWECECQDCRKVFTLPVPGSPAQEKEITCPTCGSGHIHRLTASGGVPMYCG